MAGAFSLGGALTELTKPAVIKEILRVHGLSPRKSLGQNFLIDAKHLERLMVAAEIASEDVVLEIGPGIGTVTRELAMRARRVAALEIDRGLIDVLHTTLFGFTNVTLIHADVLKADLGSVLRELIAGSSAPGGRAKIVANLPYYITSPVLSAFLEQRRLLKQMVLMVQKEVADRLRAQPGSTQYGSLAVTIQYSCNTEVVELVPPSAFLPQPDVTSAIVKVDVLPSPRVSVQDEQLFFEIVRKSFGQRRKNLKNSLSDIGGRDLSERALAESGVDPLRRGETLGLLEFAKIAEAFRNLQ